MTTYYHPLTFCRIVCEALEAQGHKLHVTRKQIFGVEAACAIRSGPVSVDGPDLGLTFIRFCEAYVKATGLPIKYAEGKNLAPLDSDLVDRLAEERKKQQQRERTWQFPFTDDLEPRGQFNAPKYEADLRRAYDRGEISPNQYRKARSVLDDLPKNTFTSNHPFTEFGRKP